MDEDLFMKYSVPIPETELGRAHRERNDERFAKYGWDFVPDATAVKIFESVVLPSIKDFVFVRKGIFVKQINKDIFHVIYFKQGKYGHRFAWYISLSFVPHKWDEDGCKFHRTLKSAQCDLSEPEENLIKNDPEAKIFPYNEIDINHGTICFFEDLTRAWENLQPVIRKWFASITTLDGVLRQARYLVESSNNPGWKLTYAFTLAKMGRFEEGLLILEELMKSCSQFYYSPELPKALRKIANIQ